MKAALYGYTYEVYVTPPTHKPDLPGIVEAQNQLILRALEGGFDYLWIVQADVQVPADAFLKLYALNVDVAQGYVCGHEDKDRLVCGYLDDNKKVWYLPRYVVKDQVLSGWVFAGLSCTLIKRRVLEAGIRFRLEPGVGEDILFLYDVQSKGFIAKVHGGVECGHLPEWPLSNDEHGDVRRKSEFKLLDVGCGHQPKGDVNVDLHPEPTAHRAADQRVCNDVKLDLKNMLNFVKADALHLPFADGSFDSVRSSHVLEHVLSPELVLAEMLRVSDRWVEVRLPHPDLKGAYGPEKPLHRNKITRAWLEQHLKGFDSQIRDEVNQGLPYELVALVDKEGVA